MNHPLSHNRSLKEAGKFSQIMVIIRKKKNCIFVDGQVGRTVINGEWDPKKYFVIILTKKPIRLDFAVHKSIRE